MSKGQGFVVIKGLQQLSQLPGFETTTNTNGIKFLKYSFKWIAWQSKRHGLRYSLDNLLDNAFTLIIVVQPHPPAACIGSQNGCTHFAITAG